MVSSSCFGLLLAPMSGYRCRAVLSLGTETFSCAQVSELASPMPEYENPWPDRGLARLDGLTWDLVSGDRKKVRQPVPRVPLVSF